MTAITQACDDCLSNIPRRPSPELAQLLDLSGFVWKGIAEASDVDRLEPEDGWGGAIVQIGDDSETGWGILRAFRNEIVPVSPL